MFDRFCLKALLLAGLLLPIAGCTKGSGLDSIQVSPTSASLAVGGPTLQMTAMGVFGNAAHPTTGDVSSQATWASAIPGVATVSASGVVTAVGAGTTTVTATAAGFAGPVSSSATITVTGGSTAGGDVVSLSIIPSAQSVASPNQTTQFLAIGTTSSGATENLTGQVAWSSSSVQIATIGAATGLATAVGQGTSTITAIYTNAADRTSVTGTAREVRDWPSAPIGGL